MIKLLLNILKDSKESGTFMYFLRRKVVIVEELDILIV